MRKHGTGATRAVKRVKTLTDNGGTWSEKNNGLTATEVRAIAIDASNTLFAGTYGIGMFRSADGGQGWEKVNNGLSALYESCLAINAAGDIFLGADFVNGAGGVFRSTDNGQRWVEVNYDVIQTDVRALAINSSGCRNLFWRRCLSIDRQRWQLDASERWLGVWKHLVSGDQFNRRNFCWNCRLRRWRLPFH
jgi:hypothetical protein